MMKPLMKWMNPGLSMGNSPKIVFFMQDFDGTRWENDDEPVDLAAPDVQMNPYIDVYMGKGQNLVPLVNIKIAGKWMFIPLKMVLIGIDPYPYTMNIRRIYVVLGTYPSRCVNKL
jgi:hypothetical protein